MKLRFVLIFLMAISFVTFSYPQEKYPVMVDYESIYTGAQNLSQVFFDSIADNKIAVVANQASIVNKIHLVDYLLENKTNVIKIFSPEHGFRGEAENGELIKGEIDSRTGLPVVSLYGDHKKATSADLKDVDVVIFDLQDVGTRFYTYISTLTYMMEACAENNLQLIVLDRPNPNGFYVDGPVLEEEFTSFIGMHPVPVVYGMTIGEYALMVNGEKWLKDEVQCKLQIVPLRGYEHRMIVKLPISPSPNLPNWESVFLYPSLCFFEGTVMSVGRGTNYPFQIYGHPDYFIGSYSFTPRSMPGKSLHPKFEDINCNGQNLAGYAQNILQWEKNRNYSGIFSLNLGWLMSSYKMLSKKTDFFTEYFNKLAGTEKLRMQIEEGLNENDIKASWKPDLDNFKSIRSKYLIYD